MRLPQLQRPLQAAVANSGYRPVLATFTLPIRPAIPSIPVTARSADGSAMVAGRRYASVKSQGAYRIPNKKTLAKKLGAKRTGDQYVIPGNIIFKQRGTIWHPGENAMRGRDHTIHATAAGYVKYYRDPELHPDRQFIGVAFNKEDTLPYPKNEPRRRKLGMVAHVRKPSKGPSPAVSASGIPTQVLRKGGLYNVAKLEKKLWSWDKKRELAEAHQAATAANAAKAAARAAKAGIVPKGSNSEASAHASALAAVTPADDTVSDELASRDAFANQIVSKEAKNATPASEVSQEAPRSKKKKFVMPLEFIQKRWLERRRTKVLILNRQNYSYMESNAAIGRLVSRTMYTPPWKLGGRKARFRNRRHRREERIRQLKADKELVRIEKEKEKIAEEKRRAAKLAKQRARGAGKSEKAAADEGAKAEGAKAEQPKADKVAAPTTKTE
ncbi:ribosomal L27 protein-domain-containing protein [Coniella lustricola]|uniref:Large ribosomal subunit protein bL27m n=1 Tax=Coniella lustricola TaxID=2025994 RepID=A0A2T3A990_9PEZI|nr:ribosomal L27 protein-domain-containing protein [Coniella lustricola]